MAVPVTGHLIVMLIVVVPWCRSSDGACSSSSASSAGIGTLFRRTGRAMTQDRKRAELIAKIRRSPRFQYPAAGWGELHSHL